MRVFILGLEIPLFTLGIKTTATKYETRSMRTGNVTPDPEAYLFSATGIPGSLARLPNPNQVIPFFALVLKPFHETDTRVSSLNPRHMFDIGRYLKDGRRGAPFLSVKYEGRASHTNFQHIPVRLQQKIKK